MKPHSVQKYKAEFAHARRQKAISKILLSFSVFLIVFSSLVYLVFLSGLFAISAIRIHAAPVLYPETIARDMSAWFDVPRAHVMYRRLTIFFSPDALAAYLKNKHPRIDTITIKKAAHNSYDITLKERQPAGIWCLPAQGSLNDRTDCAYFSADGIAYAPAANPSGYILALVEDQRDRALVLGEETAPKLWRDQIAIARSLMPGLGITVQKTLIPSDSYDEFDLVSSQGVKIMFSVNSNITNTVANLSQFLKEKITPAQLNTLQYIDLRIDNRIYYK